MKIKFIIFSKEYEHDKNVFTIVTGGSNLVFLSILDLEIHTIYLKIKDTSIPILIVTIFE